MYTSNTMLSHRDKNPYRTPSKKGVLGIMYTKNYIIDKTIRKRATVQYLKFYIVYFDYNMIRWE